MADAITIMDALIAGGQGKVFGGYRCRRICPGRRIRHQTGGDLG